MFFFFFNDTATTEIYTLSLHDALPISQGPYGVIAKQDDPVKVGFVGTRGGVLLGYEQPLRDRKSTRLNSSHTVISYAVFCLKKKKKTNTKTRRMSMSRLRTYKNGYIVR